MIPFVLNNSLICNDYAIKTVEQEMSSFGAKCNNSSMPIFMILCWKISSSKPVNTSEFPLNLFRFPLYTHARNGRNRFFPVILLTRTRNSQSVNIASIKSSY